MSFISTTPPFVTNPTDSKQIAADTENQVLKDKPAANSASAAGDLNAGYFAYLNANPTQKMGTSSFNDFYNSVIGSDPNLSKQDRAGIELAALQVAGSDNIEPNDASHWMDDANNP